MCHSLALNQIKALTFLEHMKFLTCPLWFLKVTKNNLTIFNFLTGFFAQVISQVSGYFGTSGGS